MTDTAAATQAPPKQDEKPKKPQLPESLRKKRKTAEQRLKFKKMKMRLTKKKNVYLRRKILKRAEKYDMEYQKKERTAIRLRRLAKNSGNFYVEPEPKVALVVRIRGINGVSPKVKTILRLLRLRQLNNAVFVRLNGASLQMLQLVEPYVTWGAPNLKTIRELIYKRGYAKVNGQRIAITDNKVIKQRLAKHNVICMEDIIHEIFTCGRAFKKVNSFLWPFKLSNPRGGLVKKNIHFNEGGDAGDREHFINRLVRKMN